jgi:hypothetical protein
MSVAGAYGQWLARWPWQLFVTITSERRTSPEGIFKRFRHHIAQVNDELHGRHWRRDGKGAAWVAGVERHKSGNPHLHALVYVPSLDLRDRRVFSLDDWQPRFSDGGFAWLELVHVVERVSTYLAKYILKDGDIHIAPSLQEIASRNAIGQGEMRLDPRRARVRR